MNFILQTVLCQGWEWSSEQKFYFLKEEEVWLCHEVGGLGNTVLQLGWGGDGGGGGGVYMDESKSKTKSNK